VAEPVDPKHVELALNDLDFPASKQQIVEHVERRGGSDPVLRAVRALPLADYSNVDEVKRGMPLAT
jgi:hypothetical protein